jgi:hypothetical protein
MNNELERVWKEAIVTYFKILPRHLTGGTEENHGKPQSQDIRSPDCDLNPGPPEYESGVITTQHRQTVISEIICT